jgi:hypothetical protein
VAIVRPYAIEPWCPDKAQFDAAKATLTKQFGGEPYANDVHWFLFCQALLDYPARCQHKSHRDILFHMAELLVGERRKEYALTFYLQVAYLDLNHPLDCPGGAPTARRPRGSYFRPCDGFVALEVRNRIVELAHTVHWCEEELERGFSAGSNDLAKHLGCPLDPGKAWAQLAPELRTAPRSEAPEEQVQAESIFDWTPEN